MLKRICLIINPRIVVERAMLIVVSRLTASKEKPDFRDRENRENKEKRKPR